MKTIKVESYEEIPEDFTGIVEYPNKGKFRLKDGKHHREDGPAIEYSDGTKTWYKNGKLHRLDGPAIEYSVGDFSWYVDGQCYVPVKLTDYVVLDYYQGNFGIMWYKLLGKNKIIEYPDIPGLIEK